MSEHENGSLSDRIEWTENEEGVMSAEAMHCIVSAEDHERLQQDNNMVKPNQFQIATSKHAHLIFEMLN